MHNGSLSAAEPPSLREGRIPSASQDSQLTTISGPIVLSGQLFGTDTEAHHSLNALSYEGLARFEYTHAWLWYLCVVPGISGLYVLGVPSNPSVVQTFVCTKRPQTNQPAMGADLSLGCHLPGVATVGRLIDCADIRIPPTIVGRS